MRASVERENCDKPMTTATERILRATLAADASVSQVQMARAFCALRQNGAGNDPAVEQPALLSQAAKARQLGVSRFTVRKLVEANKLHPIELLPGLLRYRADELV